MEVSENIDEIRRRVNCSYAADCNNYIRSTKIGWDSSSSKISIDRSILSNPGFSIPLCSFCTVRHLGLDFVFPFFFPPKKFIQAWFWKRTLFAIVSTRWKICDISCPGTSFPSVDFNVVVTFNPFFHPCTRTRTALSLSPLPLLLSCFVKLRIVTRYAFRDKRNAPWNGKFFSLWRLCRGKIFERKFSGQFPLGQSFPRTFTIKASLAGGPLATCAVLVLTRSIRQPC